MAGYDATKDVLIWESDTIDFKAKATLRVQIKRYNNGTPKLLLLEHGEGYNGKDYSATFLKRVDFENLTDVIQLLNNAKDVLLDFREKAANEKRPDKF